MSYEEFLEYIKEHIQEFLPNEYDESRPVIEKRNLNNGGCYYGLVVRKMNKNIAPLLNMENYYRAYKQGEHIVSLLCRIASTYYQLDEQTPVINANDFSYANVKNKIFVEVCNAEKNRKSLENAPHEIREDLALKYYVSFRYSEFEYGKVSIRNEHIQLWNVSAEEVKKQAWENIHNASKYIFKPLKEYVEDYLENESGEFKESTPDIYALTNEKGVHGAAYMFDDVVMQDIAKKLDDDLVIVPSSIDDVLIMKKSSVEDIGTFIGLRKMVEDINRSCLSLEEFLSDEIYLYERETQQLSIIDTSEQELGMSMDM